MGGDPIWGVSIAFSQTRQSGWIEIAWLAGKFPMTALAHLLAWAELPPCTPWHSVLPWQGYIAEERCWLEDTKAAQTWCRVEIDITEAYKGSTSKAFSLFFLIFLWSHLWHMEVSGPGVKLELCVGPITQPWQHWIRAISVTYAAYSNTWSLTHWARPGIKPASS